MTVSPDALAAIAEQLLRRECRALRVMDRDVVDCRTIPRLAGLEQTLGNGPAWLSWEMSREDLSGDDAAVVGNVMMRASEALAERFPGATPKEATEALRNVGEGDPLEQAAETLGVQYLERGIADGVDWRAEETVPEDFYATGAY